jgi:predicted lysophospholipase L1 biosynthesis ABC-type transport system permease subunit
LPAKEPQQATVQSDSANLLKLYIMMKLFVALILSLCHFGRAFRPLSIRHSRSDLATEIQAVNRRDLMDASLASVAALGLNLVITERADASGGATAGGAYLLSVRSPDFISLALRECNVNF